MAVYCQSVCHLPPLSSSCVFLHLHRSMAAGSVAFLQPWVGLQASAFSPFALICCLLAELRSCKVYSSIWLLLFRQMEWFPEPQYLTVAPLVALPLPPFFSDCRRFIIYTRTPMCFNFMLGAFRTLCSTLRSLF